MTLGSASVPPFSWSSDSTPRVELLAYSTGRATLRLAVVAPRVPRNSRRVLVSLAENAMVRPHVEYPITEFHFPSGSGYPPVPKRRQLLWAKGGHGSLMSVRVIAQPVTAPLSVGRGDRIWPTSSPDLLLAPDSATEIGKDGGAVRTHGLDPALDVRFGRRVQCSQHIGGKLRSNEHSPRGDVLAVAVQKFSTEFP